MVQIILDSQKKLKTKIELNFELKFEKRYFLIFSGEGGMGGRGLQGKKIKVAQNGVKHVLILKILRSDEFFEILCVQIQGNLINLEARIRVNLNILSAISAFMFLW